jgi:predicted GNAT superfamily acetyltransferase
VSPLATVAIARDLDALVTSNPGEALVQRLRVRQALMAHFSAGLEIAGYDAGAGEYLLARKAVI